MTTMISATQSKEFTWSANIKACVSSRPWNVFEDQFGQLKPRKLYVDQLTRNDIRRFVSDRLQSHPRWAMCDVKDENKTALIDDITNYANKAASMPVPHY